METYIGYVRKQNEEREKGAKWSTLSPHTTKNVRKGSIPRDRGPAGHQNRRVFSRRRGIYKTVHGKWRDPRPGRSKGTYE